MRVCVWVLTGRSWRGGTAHRQASSLGTWAIHMQPGQRACNNTHLCTYSSRPGRGKDRQIDTSVKTTESAEKSAGIYLVKSLSNKSLIRIFNSYQIQMVALVQYHCFVWKIIISLLSLFVIIYQTLSKYNPFEDKYNSHKALRTSSSVDKSLLFVSDINTSQQIL